MGPFERSHQHGPPLLGRVRGPTRSPTSSLVCSPPTPSLPSAAAPVVPGLPCPLVRQGGGLPCPSVNDKEEEGPPRCLGRPLPACRRLRPRWVRVSACASVRSSVARGGPHRGAGVEAVSGCGAGGPKEPRTGCSGRRPSSAAGQDRRAADGDRVTVREGGPAFGPAEVDAMSGAFRRVHNAAGHAPRILVTFASPFHTEKPGRSCGSRECVGAGVTTLRRPTTETAACVPTHRRLRYRGPPQAGTARYRCGWRRRGPSPFTGRVS